MALGIIANKIITFKHIHVFFLIFVSLYEFGNFFKRFLLIYLIFGAVHAFLIYVYSFLEYFHAFWGPGPSRAWARAGRCGR